MIEAAVGGHPDSAYRHPAPTPAGASTITWRARPDVSRATTRRMPAARATGNWRNSLFTTNRLRRGRVSAPD